MKARSVLDRSSGLVHTSTSAVPWAEVRHQRKGELTVPQLCAVAELRAGVRRLAWAKQNRCGQSGCSMHDGRIGPIPRGISWRERSLKLPAMTTQSPTAVDQQVQGLWLRTENRSVHIRTRFHWLSRFTFSPQEATGASKSALM